MALEALVSALQLAAGRYEELKATLSTAMGFGEATLAYLDLGQVQIEVEVAIAQLRGADLAPPRKPPLEAALAGLQPFLSSTFSAAPRLLLDELLDTVEASLAEQVVAKIEAFDPDVLAQPLVDGIGRVKAVAEQLEARLQEIVVTLRAALGRVRDALPLCPSSRSPPR